MIANRVLLAPATCPVICSGSTFLSAANEKDWQEIKDLTHRCGQVHEHLDWQNPKVWLGISSFVVARCGQSLSGCLAILHEVDGVAWIRLAAVEEGVASRGLMDQMYQLSCEALKQHSVTRVAVLNPDPWLELSLVKWGFAASDIVVVMVRDCGNILSQSEGALTIRAYHPKDLAAIVSIDNAAFAAPWAHSSEMLRTGLGTADYSTVAELDGHIVGYQISTGGRDNAHMGRLAVHPGLQKRGIGRILVGDVIRHFETCSTQKISVNTQEDNDAAQNLYSSLGFRQTGDSYVVWQLWLRHTMAYL